eukprot:399522-Pyramimonas_sp.AAC.1
MPTCTLTHTLTHTLTRTLPTRTLTGMLTRMAQEVSGSQVALAWCMAKGTVPIPGARSLTQCRSNLAAMRLSLSASEVDALDQAAMCITTPMVQNSMASN